MRDLRVKHCYINEDGDPILAEEVLDSGPMYAPNSRKTKPLPPGVNPDSLVVYSNTEGQD